MMTEVKVNFTEVRLAYNSVEARLKEIGASKMDLTNFLNQCIYTKLKEEFGINLWDRKAKYGIESDRLYFFFNTMYELQTFKKLCRVKLDEVEETGVIDFSKNSETKNTNNKSNNSTKDKTTKDSNTKEQPAKDKTTKEPITKDKKTTMTKSVATIKESTNSNKRKFDISNQLETCKLIRYLNKINCIFISLDTDAQVKFEKELYKNLVKKSNGKCNVYNRMAQDIDAILEHFETLNDFIINLASRLTSDDNLYIVEAVKLTKENLKIAA